MTVSINEIGLRIADKLTQAIANKPGRKLCDKSHEMIQAHLRLSARVGKGTISTKAIRLARDHADEDSKFHQD